MRSTITQKLVEEGIAAVIRLDDPERLLPAAEALLEGGVHVLEVTMTTPRALALIEQLAEAFAPDALIGVGSVLDGETAAAAIDAGAQFVVSPVLNADLIAAVHAHDRAVLPGAFTPTEMQRAHALGADLVKVFPASQGGPGYLRSVRAPLPHLRLMPTGGVTADNVGAWFEAGASAVGVGSALVDTHAIANENYSILTENARTLRSAVRASRA